MEVDGSNRNQWGRCDELNSGTKCCLAWCHHVEPWRCSWDIEQHRWVELRLLVSLLLPADHFYAEKTLSSLQEQVEKQPIWSHLLSWKPLVTKELHVWTPSAIQPRWPNFWINSCHGWPWQQTFEGFANEPWFEQPQKSLDPNLTLSNLPGWKGPAEEKSSKKHSLWLKISQSSTTVRGEKSHPETQPVNAGLWVPADNFAVLFFLSAGHGSPLLRCNPDC